MSKIVFKLYQIAHRIYCFGVPLIPEVITVIIRVVSGSYIPHSAVIGSGSRLSYGGVAIVIHPRTVAGKNVVFGANSTVGGRSDIFGVPVIGDNVYIGSGAKVLGNITIGNNAKIGANAVVLEDVPAGAVVVGIPARIVRVES